MDCEQQEKGRIKTGSRELSRTLVMKLSIATTSSVSLSSSSLIGYPPTELAKDLQQLAASSGEQQDNGNEVRRKRQRQEEV